MRLITPGALVAAILLTFLSLANFNSALETCKRVEATKAYIVTAALRGKETAPTLSYYKEHPDELKRANDAYDRVITEFSPVECRATFRPYPF